MISPLAPAIALASVVFVGLAAAKCANVKYGSCSGGACCPTDFFCQNFIGQCLPVPTKCPTQLPNVGFGGINVTKVTYSSEECCDGCTKTHGCVGYTFVKAIPGSNSTCYLMNSATTSFPFTGAVSAMLDPADVYSASPQDSKAELSETSSWNHDHALDLYPDPVLSP